MANINENKEAYQMMKNALGSIENRFREAYNKGYHDGVKEGINQTTQKLVDKLFDEIENEGCEDCTPQTDCETCRYGQDKHRYAHICNECGVGINNYTPQTDCGWGEPK